jgi:hypothetical protein
MELGIPKVPGQGASRAVYVVIDGSYLPTEHIRKVWSSPEKRPSARCTIKHDFSYFHNLPVGRARNGLIMGGLRCEERRAIGEIPYIKIIAECPILENLRIDARIISLAGLIAYHAEA